VSTHEHETPVELRPRRPLKPPRYELRRLSEEGEIGEPQILPVNRVPWTVGTDRRGFLGVGLASSAAMVALAACQSDGEGTTVARAKPLLQQVEPPAIDLELDHKTVATTTTSAPPPPDPLAPPDGGGGSTIPGGGGTICTCNQICTCIPICQAHRLLDDDRVVRAMGEHLLTVMGRNEFEYMRWAADSSPQARRHRIHRAMARIDAGGSPSDLDVVDVLPYLEHRDPVVAVMAAQTLALEVSTATSPAIAPLLAAAHAMSWRRRVRGAGPRSNDPSRDGPRAR